MLIVCVSLFLISDPTPFTASFISPVSELTVSFPSEVLPPEGSELRDLAYIPVPTRRPSAES